MSDERAIQWATKELRASSGVTSLLSSPVTIAPGDASNLPSKPGVYVSAERTMYREQHADIVVLRVDVMFRGTRTRCADIVAAVRLALHQSPTNRKVWLVAPSSVGLRLKACRYKTSDPPMAGGEDGKSFFTASAWFHVTCLSAALAP